MPQLQPALAHARQGAGGERRAHRAAVCAGHRGGVPGGPHIVTAQIHAPPPRPAVVAHQHAPRMLMCCEKHAQVHMLHTTLLMAFRSPKTELRNRCCTCAARCADEQCLYVPMSSCRRRNFPRTGGARKHTYHATESSLYHIIHPHYWYLIAMRSAPPVCAGANTAPTHGKSFWR